MNTLHFQYAMEVARKGSITQAADSLFMAQPNLSKAIKELEANLGFAVFERTRKGMIPTQKGAEFLKYARKAMDQIKKMEALSRSDDNVQTFSISISGGCYLACAFTDFASELDRSKGIRISIQETNSVQTIHNIMEGRSNLGIIRYPTEYEHYFLDYLSRGDLGFELIWEFERLLVFSENNPLSRAGVVENKDLVELIELVHGDDIIPDLSWEGTKKESLPSQAETQTRKRIVVHERGTRLDLLSNHPSTYMWESPMPGRLLRLYRLAQRRCDAANQRYRDLLVYPKDYVFSELDKKYMNKLQEAKDEAARKA